MRSIFLSHKQVFESPLPLFAAVGRTAEATDFTLLCTEDDGFFVDGGTANYFLDGSDYVDRFGRSDGECQLFAVRPVLQLDSGEEKQLRHLREAAGLATAEFGSYPSVVLDASLRDMAERQFADGTLADTGIRIHAAGEEHPVYRLGAKQIVRMTLKHGGVNGFVRLSDGTVLSEGDSCFLELRPVRWFYDAANSTLISVKALFSGLGREQAAAYLASGFLDELLAEPSDALPQNAPFRVEQHDELSLIRAYVEADIPVFIHGLSGDGKSDRVKEIDPQVLDIELVNETPETINGRAIYNETKNEIIDVKPVWLIKLEELCRDGKTHILFFDELTNATKQTQSVIFKIVLERVVNNRWPLPSNARVVAAGNDRAESSAAHDLAEPLFGRFAHIYIRTTVENWMPWAVENRLNPYVLEFLANNDLYLRTAYTGTEGHADPRRWEMVSRVLNSSCNDFSLLTPIVGRDTADAFISFFRAQSELKTLGSYTDEELRRFNTARRYQLAQQCVYASAARPEEARALVARLGQEFLAWFDYILEARKQHRA